MSKIIAVTNQKGGVGKTTTAVNVAAGLRLRGYKTLLVDLDAQCNATFAMRANNQEHTIMDVLKGTVPAEKAVCNVLIAASPALSGADAIFTQVGKEYRLKEALQAIEKEYDVILLDTPPALSILSIMALTAATHLLIPAQADVFTLQGIVALNDTVSAVRQYTNPQLKLMGLLLTRYQARSILSQEMTSLLEQTAAQMGTKLLSSRIRESVSVKEAAASQQSVFEYDPKSNGALDYATLIDEIVRQWEE